MVPATVSTYLAEYDYYSRQESEDAQFDRRRSALTHHEQGHVRRNHEQSVRPWVKRAATLYSREFWEIAKDHLNPGGVVTVWVQLYENSQAAVESSMATFFEAFPVTEAGVTSDNHLFALEVAAFRKAVEEVDALPLVYATNRPEFHVYVSCIDSIDLALVLDKVPLVEMVYLSALVIMCLYPSPRHRDRAVGVTEGDGDIIRMGVDCGYTRPPA